MPLFMNKPPLKIIWASAAGFAAFAASNVVLSDVIAAGIGIGVASAIPMLVLGSAKGKTSGDTLQKFRYDRRLQKLIR